MVQFYQPAILVRSRPPVESVLRGFSVLLLIAVALAACTSTPSSERSFSNLPEASASPFLQPIDGATASPAPPALPSEPPPTSGAASASCVSGWSSPERGSRRYTEPIDTIRRTSPFSGAAVVVEMRYFTGPESPPSDKGYLLQIERWYVKLYAASNPAYQGRFLVESRTFGRGVAAVAPYDTAGFDSPEWVGFQWDGADTGAKRYAGLPGSWSGVPYDFVKGGAGI